MPTRESYAQGTPAWVDLATTDLNAAKEFYAGVFGWQYEDQGSPDDADYSLALVNGHVVAGIAQMRPEMAERMPPAWSTYLAVDDVDDIVNQVEVNGGGLVTRPMAIGDMGRTAFITDPTGAAVGLWQAGSHIGARLVNEAGTVVWNECFTEHVESAAKFYDALLGTTHLTEDMGGPEPYTTLRVDGNVVGGFLRRDPQRHGEIPNCWTVYFASADIDDTVEKVDAGGGTVMNGPFPTPLGAMIVAADPQGAVFQVFQPSAQPADQV